MMDVMSGLSRRLGDAVSYRVDVENLKRTRKTALGDATTSRAVPAVTGTPVPRRILSTASAAHCLDSFRMFQVFY